jgi:ATP-dependent HslUV protease ATP-binding subunit HslU
LERLLDTISYDAPEQRGQHHSVDAAYVDKHLAALVQDQDLSRYIL